MAKPRQAAIAAYTTVAPPEPSRSAPATAFADILEDRRRFIESLTEQNPSDNTAIQVRAVDNSNAPTFKAVNAAASPPINTAAAGAPPKPLPEFNRRLHRSNIGDTSWEVSKAAAERGLRVLSFASGVEDDSYTDELDELDIPAFLRRGN